MARFAQAASAVRDQRVEALARHRRLIADLEDEIARLRSSTDETAPEAYCLAGGLTPARTWRRVRIMELNTRLAAARADIPALEASSARATARAIVAERLSRK